MGTLLVTDDRRETAERVVRNPGGARRHAAMATIDAAALTDDGLAGLPVGLTVEPDSQTQVSHQGTERLHHSGREADMRGGITTEIASVGKMNTEQNQDHSEKSSLWGTPWERGATRRRAPR